MRNILLGCAVLLLSASFGQTAGGHSPNTGHAGGGVHATSDFVLTLPNLIDAENVILDPFTNTLEDAYRPELINLDGVTIREVLALNGVQTDGRLIVQVIRVTKVTPYLKCTAFVTGPGAGINTNFDSGNKKATDADLDKYIVKLAFGIPQDQVALGNRALLFSPPGTTYTLAVVYVVLDANGRPGAPQLATVKVVVEVPSIYKIDANTDFFAHVAAGATQKPKIDALPWYLLDQVYEAVMLGNTDDLTALLYIETFVADFAIDFSMLRDHDDRFYHDYIVDSDEEPIGCLLIEQANALLWH